MNPKQLMGMAGGFLLVYVVITLTNKPVVTPHDAPGTVASADAKGGQASAPERVRGITLLPWPSTPVDDAGELARFAALAATGARWVALRPVVTQPTGTATEVPSDGAPEAYVAAWRRVVQAAHAAGLSIMLRPMVTAADGTRRESIAPPDAEAWLASWERALQPWLVLAREERVAMVCLGSNLTRLQGEVGWRDLVARTRTLYTGKLTYASSVAGEAYQRVGWWDALDYVGLDAFFPLASQAEPDDEALRQGWTAVADGLEAWRQAHGGPPVLFTAVGVPRLAGGAAAPAAPDAAAAPDAQLPARAAQALFATVWHRPWFAGLFWHTWSGGGDAHAPYQVGDTPTAEALQAGFQAETGFQAPR